MIDFIRRNKVFSVCFSFCLVIILFLSTLLTLKKLDIDENILVLPIIHPNTELVDPEFTLFKGNFDDEKNTIFLTWDYKLNSHSFQKVEIYYENQIIGTYYDERQINIPVMSNHICTGYTEFEKLSITKTHLLPNLKDIIIITTLQRIPSCIFLESFLSFIGIGIQPPYPSLGKMISEGLKYFRLYPRELLIPCFVLIVIILNFNYILKKYSKNNEVKK